MNLGSFFKMSLLIKAHIMLCTVLSTEAGDEGVYGLSGINLGTPAFCYPRCQNFGICVGFNKCVCPSNFMGNYCEIGTKPWIGFPMLSLPMNSPKPHYAVNTVKPINPEPSQKSNQLIEPLCSPSCQNSGNCVARNKCECPTNFSGRYCEVESGPCLGFPALPVGNTRECDTNGCKIKCQEGYKFSDGTNSMRISCKNGQWRSSRPDGDTSPVCEPQCNPSCVNGGECVGVNKCKCSQEFRGPLCQYRESDCDASRMGFNGDHKCLGDDEKLKCRVKCPSGATITSPPEKFYTCEYSTGVYQPQPIPQCVYN